jgi:hypothetical protein
VDVEKHPLPSVLGWLLWMAVFCATVLVVWRGRQRMRAVSCPAASFVLLGAIFSCYHFMYYDALVAGLPVLLLFMEPRRYLRAAAWRWPRWVNTVIPLLLVVLMMSVPPICCALDPTYHFPPTDTFALLLLWVWCGYRVLAGDEEIDSVGDGLLALDGAIQPAELAKLGTGIVGAHERLADQHGADAGRL